MTDEDRSSSGEKVIKTACALCVHSCGMDATVRDGKIINVKGMEEHPYNKGQLCPRGEAALEFEYAPDRLKYPMKKADGKWERISWDEAINTIATAIGKIKEDHGARAVTFGLGSIGAEDIVTAAITQRFRGAFGSPNYISAESICFHSLILSRILTFGRFPLEEPQNAKCLIIWGSNIDDSNIGRARMVREAVANGAHLIVIDPKRTPLAKEGLYFQIRPGTDGALAMGMLNVIINENWYDKEFVERWTVGFDQLVERVQEYSAANVEAVTGISASDIKRIARIFSETKPACIVQGTCALDQQANGMQTLRAMAILQAITGNYEIPGSWVRCPIIRLSDLRMLPDEKPMGVEQYPLFGEIWGRTFPYGQGLSFPDIVLTGEPYPIKAFIGIGLNWALTFPESKKFVKALEKLDLVVLMDVVMNETMDYADIVLPAATFFEKLSLGYTYGVVDGIPYVLCRKKCVDPPGECRSEFELWRHLALRMGLENHIPWENETELLSYFLEPSGITLADLMGDKASGCYFAEMRYKTYEEKGFATPSGKIELYSKTLLEHGYDPLPNYRAPVMNPDYPLMLITGTRLPEYTHSQMRGCPTLRKTMPEALAEINPVTGDQYGLKDGEVGIVETHKGSIKIKMKYADDLIAGTVSIPHGWADSNANELTDLDQRDEISGFPLLKAIMCRIRGA
ncbi:MAG: molybdopterin-dependent oxidoreductase [Deltaproteobacteria bacterium]|nr:molybdopterin-dependent oxidoreductase [Deltaproteobacteria bacterium]